MATDAGTRVSAIAINEVSLLRQTNQAAHIRILVNGTAKAVGWMAGYLRHIQTGYLYTYAFSMIIGLLLLLSWFLWLGQ